MNRAIVGAWLLGASLCSAQVYFEAGPWFRGGMELSVEGGSRAAAEGALAASPGTRGGMAWVEELDPADDGTGQVLRTFDDGYVGPSGWAWASALGQSQYFGYESAGQYDAGAGTLTFTRANAGTDVRRRTTTAARSGAPGWRGEKDLEGAGALATLGLVLAKKGAWEVSVQAQAGWLEGLDAEFSGEGAWSQQVEWTTRESAMERSQNWIYAFDTLGNPVFPTAPYEMTSSTGTGPMIADRPATIEQGAGLFTATDRVAGRRSAGAASRVDLEADMQALALAVGPRLKWRPTERLAVVAQGGATLNLLDAELERTETFSWEGGATIGSWRELADEQEWLWGASVSAGIQFGLTEKLYLSAGAGYDWVECHELAVGPDRIEVDLSGWRADAALGLEW